MCGLRRLGILLANPVPARRVLADMDLDPKRDAAVPRRHLLPRFMKASG
jgi:hypothetical protein